MTRAQCLSSMLLVLLATACGEEFPSPANVRSLRVLGVQADPPSAQPGDAVHFKMLLADSREPATFNAQTQVLWIGGCHNPPGLRYYGCLPALSAAADELANLGTTPSGTATASGFSVSTSAEFTLQLPTANLIVPVREGSLAIPFGVSYVFFAACRGTLKPKPGVTDTLPVACYAADGRELGPDDFVAGYSTVYIYEALRSANPIITHATLDGVSLKRTPCQSQDECSGLGEGKFEFSCSPSQECIPVLPACAGDKCPKHRFAPILDPASVELDPTGVQLDGSSVREVLWVKYFSIAGDVETEEALVHDRNSGWNDDYSTEWLTPAEASDVPVPLWAVVQDNRGGVAWWTQEVLVR